MFRKLGQFTRGEKNYRGNEEGDQAHHGERQIRKIDNEINNEKNTLINRINNDLNMK